MDTMKITVRRRILAPWRLSEADKERVMKETGWADGLRGIAAVMVVSSHLVLCYARGLVPPCCAAGSTSPYLFQLPVLRLVASGHSWVAIFFVLMGFVNALKPLQLARAGQTDKALTRLGPSAFTRTFRLALPATAATVISWFMCNLGMYHMASLSDAYWLSTDPPRPSSSWPQAVGDLLAGLRATWLFGPQNPYDQPQWALAYLLQGSVMIIAALSLVIPMTWLWRTVTLTILSAWSLNWSRVIGDPWAGLCCFAGIMLGDFSLSAAPRLLVSRSAYLSPPMMLTALVLMSYPGSFYQAAAWSNWLHDFAVAYLPVEKFDAIDRMYGSLGGILLIFAIIISPQMRWALSRPPLLWLGKVSFAIYLLHGMVLRTVFAWILHLGHPMQQVTQYTDEGGQYVVDRYLVPGYFQCALATVVAVVLVGFVSQAWQTKMEPIFAKITLKLEAVVTGRLSIEVKSSENGVLPLRND